MDAWLSTGEAAALLGTSTTTIRTMACRGELVHRVTGGTKRQKWTISRDSAQSWLASHGRIDDRRRSRQAVPTRDDEVRRQLENLTEQYQSLLADRDRLSDEVASLRTVAFQLRARNEAVTEAESYQAQAAKLLLDATRLQAQATDALRRGLSAQDDALGQLLVPGLSNIINQSRADS